MDRDEEIESQLLSRRYVQQSRKTYECRRCGLEIAIGSQYVREFWLVDGAPCMIQYHSGYCD